MKDKVEQEVKKYYDSEGWSLDQEGKSQEENLFRTYSTTRYSYSEFIIQKIVDTFDQSRKGNLLIAGCGDMPESHIRIAGRFDTVICLDISTRAIDVSKGKGLPNAIFTNASILNLPIPDESFDAVFCAHVLYHIYKDKQESAVRELIRITKPGGIITFLYINPSSPLMLIQRMLKSINLNKLWGKDKLYTDYFPLPWWDCFLDSCSVSIYPLDVISSSQSRVLLPNEVIGNWFYQWAEYIEMKSPKIATKLFTYIIVVLIREE